ncbi:hypothetical protein Tco_0612338 [Tanacetum coccineum]
MGDENPIRTLEDYSKPSNESYRNTIELPEGNNVVPLRSDTIRLCEIDRAAGGKLHDKNTIECWEIIKNLTLYDHKGWNDSKDSIKPVKAISVSPNASKMLDRRLLELEDQINFLLKGPKPVPRASSTNISQVYAEAISSNPHLRNLNEPPRQIYFTFCERIRPNPQPEALGTNFKAQVRDYMALHTERMERFENAIFKQREKINDKMAEMFGLLKELTASRTPDKVLIREETRHPTTKNVNSISLIRIEEEKNVENNGATDKSVAEPSKSDEQEPPKEVDKTNKGGRRADDEPAKSARENITKNEKEEPAGISSSHTVGYYLKHKINEKLIEGLVENQRFNDSLSTTQVGKVKRKTYNLLLRGPVYEAILEKKITRK